MTNSPKHPNQPHQISINTAVSSGGSSVVTTSSIAGVTGASSGLGNPDDVGNAYVTPKMSNKQIEAIIYSHLQTLRAMGRTTASPDEIAEMLSLPYSAVLSAMKGLKDKGVNPL
jgi:hypothetical protein